MTAEWENSGDSFLDADFVMNAPKEMDESQEESTGSLWKIIYTSFVLLIMFVALISDKVGADMVMMVALTLLMASKIITIQEALEGFANEGLLTVLVLFVVAAGISHTGALVSFDLQFFLLKYPEHSLPLLPYKCRRNCK